MRWTISPVRAIRLFAFCARSKVSKVWWRKGGLLPIDRDRKRTDDWVKYKCETEGDFVVVGWTVGSGGRESLGALDLAGFRGDDLVVVGKVGSGLSRQVIEGLLPRLESLEVAEPMAEGTWPPAKRGRRYVRPEMVVSVRYLDATEQGQLRHPVFRGLREDVSIRDAVAPAMRDPDADDGIFAVDEPEATSKKARTAGSGRVSLTNQDKVFWPADGLTKGDLCEYYEAIAEVILPFLAERPTVLVRYPDGIEGKSFYQWRVPKNAPPWVRAFSHRAIEVDAKDKTTFLLDSVDALLYVANLGCIPLHVLAGRASSPDECDFLTVDFDIGGGTLRAAVGLARLLKELCDDVGLDAFPKTSGQSGLHVLVPLGPGVSFDTAKMLAQIMGRFLVTRFPKEATMQYEKKKRGRRVYVDVGQTGRARTIVAPYSVRAYPGARVSTPLTWDEVGFALDPGAFTIRTVPDRVASIEDPMARLLEARPKIAEVVEALGAALGST